MDNMSENGTVKLEGLAKQSLTSQTMYTYDASQPHVFMIKGTNSP